MMEVRVLSSLSWLCFAMLSITSLATTPIAKPGCPSSCGKVTIPYPFGIGEECSLSQPYNVQCNTSYDPPKPFLFAYNSSQLEIIDISHTGQMRIRNKLFTKCYNQGQVVSSTEEFVEINLEHLPLVFSHTSNKFFTIGCNDFSFLMMGDSTPTGQTSGCLVKCSREDMLMNITTSCSGEGCCRTEIPIKGSKLAAIMAFNFGEMANNSNNWPYCSAAFLAEENKFTFNFADLAIDNAGFINRTRDNVPAVLEWYVGVNETCDQAQQKPSGYACKENTQCTDIDDGSESGYRCSCLSNYQGNPYLSPGCSTDVDECAGPSNPCSHFCKNTFGSYECYCPKNYRLENRTQCVKKVSSSSKILIIGLSLGCFAFVLAMVVVCTLRYIYKKRKLQKMREKFFEQNGGVLLTQQLSPNGRTMESSKIFSVEELEEATNNYHEDRVLGKGGYGTVYKGILKDGREVAIKKSRVSDQTQVEQFINELVILTQINHRNVVKLLGCCLETEVPLLVYELVSNGTLFDHIQINKRSTSWLTWANCIRIAAEAAGALSYLHSAASIPIIHRDVKSSNILLDESYTAKISDFGISRLIPIDKDEVTTLVQGTFGYLDPEYLHTSQLTEKSDVYSFGIVLAELLTKEKPISAERKIEERNLAAYFTLSVMEDRLMEILDPQLVREASEEQLVSMAKLVMNCLNIKGEDRPTMKDVALELEGLRKQNRHPWAEQSYEDQTTDLLCQQDLYPLPSKGYNANPSSEECTGQFTMQMDMINEMNQPR